MNNDKSIPFLDLITLHRELRNELMNVFSDALGTAGFIGGPVVEAFEHEFAAFCDVSHCVGVNSGTDALRFALIAAGVRAGEIVVTVPNTFIATAEAISQAGARPVFVDVDENTYNMDPAKLEEYLRFSCVRQGRDLIDRKLKRRVYGVVPVHLYGQPADMDPILDLAQRHGLMVIEDACQAHGAEYFSKRAKQWKKAGAMGYAAAFSFYPGKNLGACGEGGAVTTCDAELAQRIRMLRDHGQSTKYYHEIEGYNGRLDALQAGLLRVKLKHLVAWNERRRRCAECYRDLFDGAGAVGCAPYVPSWAKPVYHLYVVRAENRDRLQAHLSHANIGTGIHYPVPLHLQNAYKHLGYQQGDFPICERVASEILSLPMYPGLESRDQQRIVERVTEVAALVVRSKEAAMSQSAGQV